MVIKMNKADVEEACILWLRAHKRSAATSDKGAETSDSHPVAVDHSRKITCRHTQVGADCTIVRDGGQ